MLKKDGKESGPFSKEDVAGMLADGRISNTDLAFHEGLSNWLPVLAVITPRATPPPFKEKSESFESARVKPNETVAQIVSQTKSLDWKQVFPYEAILQDKPWNLRWVRWMLWFTCTFVLINYLVAKEDLSSDQAQFFFSLDWLLMLALGLSFIIKPDRFQIKRALCLIVPSLLISEVLLITAGKVTFINSLYQATVSDEAIKRTTAILVTIAVNQLILVGPLAFVYLKKKRVDSLKTIMFYGLLAGLAISTTPALTPLLQQKWDSLNGESLGIFDRQQLVLQCFSIMTGIWGALTGYLMAFSAKDQKNIFGWLVASVLLPVVLETGYFATVSSLIVILVILASVFVLAIYIKKNHEPDI